jgi:CRISPR-associated endonuclease/helicase Cas3
MTPSPHLSLWAKLGRIIYPESYHPLLFHLIDVGAVACRLWEIVLRQPLKERFAAAVGLPLKDCGPWVTFWVAAHDIGKASPGFQQRDNTALLVERLRGLGYDFDAGKPVFHATVSVPVLADWLERGQVQRSVAQRIAHAVGGHHGVFPPPDSRGLGARVLGNTAWTGARNDLLAWLADLFDVPVDRSVPGGRGDDQSYLMVLAGLTTVADWVGSNQTFFPPAGDRDNCYDDRAERVPEYARRAGEQADKALGALGWCRPTDLPREQPPFRELFKYLSLPSVRDLQQTVAAHAARLDGPTLFLVESPMGEGKTEAAFCLADAWERRGGQGVYIAMPTMATSNGMFTRFLQFLDANYPGRKNLHLLHGQALLSEVYQQLVHLAHEHPPDFELYDDDRVPSSVVADGWFAQDRKHGLLAPFAVGTIDQALLSVLQTRHGFVRLYGLAGKVVILDEVHAYDVYTSTLLRRLLRWLAALGCPVVLLSATLPGQKRRELLEEYAGGPLGLVSDKPYPRISVTRPRGTASVSVEHVPASSTKTLRLAWQDGDLADLAGRLSDAMADGGCAAVVRNTVGLAQQTYRALKERLPADVELELFHARFPFGQRQAIERRVVDRYGKAGPRPLKAVLVATQVVEQSLDLDFDLLVTDLAPVDLVLQRAGRLWRHDNRARPAGFKEPTVWLLRPVAGAERVPDFGVSELIYERFVLLRSHLALGERGTVTLPTDVEAVIESVYGAPPLPEPPSSAWSQALAEANDKMRTAQREDRKAAKTFLVTKPVDEDEILYEFNQQLQEDNPDVPREHQAFTRLAEPSVSLVILYETNSMLCLDVDGKRPVSLSRRPNIEDARAFLANAVTVQHKGCVWHYAKKSPPAPWKQSGLLRFYRVIRVDGAGRSRPDEYPLTVDPQAGVMFDRAQDRDA